MQIDIDGKLINIKFMMKREIQLLQLVKCELLKSHVGAIVTKF